MLANADDRPPEVVDVLLFPRQDARIGHRGVHQREQASVVLQAVGAVDCHLPHDLVVEARGRNSRVFERRGQP